MDTEIFWRLLALAWIPLLMADVLWGVGIPPAGKWLASALVSVWDWAVEHPYGDFLMAVSALLFPLDKVLDLVYGDAKAKWISPTLLLLLAGLLTYGVYRSAHKSSEQRRTFEATLANQQAALEVSIDALGDRINAEARIRADAAEAEASIRAERAEQVARQGERRILQFIDKRMPRRG